MITLFSGPADGQTLMLRRAPALLRITQNGEEFDGLDQLDDQPEPGEVVHVYLINGKPGWMHIRARAPAPRGRFMIAEYDYLVTPPAADCSGVAWTLLVEELAAIHCPDLLPGDVLAAARDRINARSRAARGVGPALDLLCYESLAVRRERIARKSDVERIGRFHDDDIKPPIGTPPKSAKMFPTEVTDDQLPPHIRKLAEEKREEIIRQAIEDGEFPDLEADEEPGGRCPHCGKLYEDMSDFGCGRCDFRDPCWGLT